LTVTAACARYCWELAAALLIVATSYASWANFSLAMMQQRIYAYPVAPDKRFGFQICVMPAKGDEQVKVV
jgi:hypothetical protein